MEFEPLRRCGPYNYGVYACVATDEFVRTTMEFTPVWLPMSLSVQLWSFTLWSLCGTDEFVRTTMEFVRTTMEFTPVWLPKSLSVQLWSLRLCGYR